MARQAIVSSFNIIERRTIRQAIPACLIGQKVLVNPTIGTRAFRGTATIPTCITATVTAMIPLVLVLVLIAICKTCMICLNVEPVLAC